MTEITIDSAQAQRTIAQVLRGAGMRPARADEVSELATAQMAAISADRELIQVLDDAMDYAAGAYWQMVCINSRDLSPSTLEQLSRGRIPVGDPQPDNR